MPQLPTAFRKQISKAPPTYRQRVSKTIRSYCFENGYDYSYVWTDIYTEFFDLIEYSPWYNISCAYLTKIGHKRLKITKEEFQRALLESQKNKTKSSETLNNIEEAGQMPILLNITERYCK